MRSLLPVWMCFLLVMCLLPLEIQSRACPTLTRRLRSSLSRHLRLPEEFSFFLARPTVSNPYVVPDKDIALGDRHVLWRALLHKGPPSGLSGPKPDRNHNASGDGPAWSRGSRGRRHANAVLGRGYFHGHLMRVGCVLGTCQVQNLSHRLHQLIGQSGREDSSPINPRSPHSYG